MKIVNKDFVINQAGTVTVIPEQPDDLWIVYNLVAVGDVITADTTRKIHLDFLNESAPPTRVNLSISVKVMSRDFQKDDSTVRIQGADLAVILLKEERAEIYLVGKGLTTLCSKVEASGTSKRSRGGRNLIFPDLFSLFVKRLDFATIKSVVIASNGSMKDEFRSFLLSEAKRLKMKNVEDNKSRLVVAECKGGLKEVLNDSGVMNMIKNSRVVLEIRAFRELWEGIESNSGRACYGAKNVEAALEMMAIETLLITDELYRSADVKTRQKYTNMVKSVKKGGGKALVYSSMHVSAEQLAQLTGVAAILRFPLPYLDDMHL
ncbi:protein PELOTA 1-like [Senna tora]|uniref:Protein PELOTA 1-like n=1 Tax=Senna tora TaxID=362788 RepID=A0A834WF70_9FABA|nr:protein PELOTA 1-like [Senna tora]